MICDFCGLPAKNHPSALCDDCRETFSAETSDVDAELPTQPCEPPDDWAEVQP